MKRRRLRSLLLVALIALGGCAGPGFVERLTFANDGDFPAYVQVGDPQRSEWLTIGIAQANAETSFAEVIDQGETWVFRFRYLGHQQEVEIEREDLEQVDWTVEVPLEFESMLRDEGFEPPP